MNLLLSTLGRTYYQPVIQTEVVSLVFLKLDSGIKPHYKASKVNWKTEY